MEPTVIMIYHRDEGINEAIAQALVEEPDFGIIAKYNNTTDLRRVVTSQLPDLLIMGFTEESTSELDTARYLRRHIPSLALIFTVTQEDDKHLLMVMKAGAAACVPETIPAEGWRQVVEAVVDGQWPIADQLLRPEIAALVLTEFEAPSKLRDLQNDILTNLLPSETELLLGIAAGNVTGHADIPLEPIRKSLRSIVHKLTSNNDIAMLLVEYDNLITR